MKEIIKFIRVGSDPVEWCLQNIEMSESSFSVHEATKERS